MVWLFYAISAVMPASMARAAEPLRIDAAFPGGNIVLESIQGDRVVLHQDLRDTRGWWFYWAFRVRGAAGRTLTFRFTNRNPIGVRGPAVSVDGGRKWSWLGTDAVDESSFRFSFAKDANDVRFSVTIPYLEADLKAFLDRNRASPYLGAGVLCLSRKGRSVEKLRVGRLDGKCRYRVLLTARHHACEAIASYSMEGILTTVLSGSEDGAWFRNNVEIMAMPFMDKDGVEDGDQGKNRQPHDHNRDYAGDSIYPEVRTLRQTVPEWSGGRLRVFLDMHCPALRGADHERILFAGGPEADIWKRMERLSAILEDTERGVLRFRAAGNMPWGTSWNNASDLGQQQNSRGWASGLPGMGVASTIEIPYANVEGQTVTAESARAFGADLAHALRTYLEEEGR
jgi:hypothetical protein